MIERRTSNLMPVIGLLLLAVLSCYVGGYVVFVEVIHPQQRYPGEQDTVAALLHPVHWVDRKLRPLYWRDREIAALLKEIIRKQEAARGTLERGGLTAQHPTQP